VAYKPNWDTATQGDFDPLGAVTAGGAATATWTIPAGKSKATLPAIIALKDYYTEGLERFSVEVIDGSGYQAASKTVRDKISTSEGDIFAKGLVICDIFDKWTLFGRYDELTHQPKPSDPYDAMPDDIAQQRLGDCFALAVAAGMAQFKRDSLRYMFKIVGNVVHTIFKFWSNYGWGPPIVKSVPVVIQLGGDGATTGLLMKDGVHGTGETNADGAIEIWNDVLEKAYAIFRIQNGFDDIDSGGMSV